MRTLLQCVLTGRKVHTFGNVRSSLPEGAKLRRKAQVVRGKQKAMKGPDARGKWHPERTIDPERPEASSATASFQNFSGFSAGPSDFSDR